MAEKWRTCTRDKRYKISSRGRVLSLYQPGHPRVLKQTTGDKYPRVGIGGKMVRVHILVLEAFAGPRQPGQEARHLNDIKTDNRWPENLCWGTENQADAVHNGTHHQASKTHCGTCGLPYDKVNTYVTPDGRRDCRACKRRRKREANHPASLLPSPAAAPPSA
jgi:hypothetical protein